MPKWKKDKNKINPTHTTALNLATEENKKYKKNTK